MGTNSPLATYGRMEDYLISGKFDRMGDVVDLENYTENCVGLTGWTTGFKVALENWMRGFGSAWSEMKPTREDALESGATGIIRQRIEAKHTGHFMGIPPTGRTVTFEMVDMFKLREGRIVWRWVFVDLHGIERQLKDPQPGA